MIVDEDKPKIPIKDRISNNSIIVYLKKSIKRGELPYLIFLVVGLYNVIVFDPPPGYGIYTTLPFGIGIAMYYVKMWKRGNKYRISGKIVLSILFVFDFFVSTSFIPGNSSEIYKYQSIPTAILDLIGLYLLLTQTVTVEAKNKENK